MTTPDTAAPTADSEARTFVPTRAAGLARLAAFQPQAGRIYATERNYDHGPGERDNVSMLSPWIRHRLVREDEVLRRVLDRYAFETAGKFIQECVWRTYWKGWLEMRPAIWQRYRADVEDAVGQLDRDSGLRQRYEEASTGRTGIIGFDDWAIEMLTEGYLHNHARLWFASIWIFTLNLPWVLGADLFFRHLLDGDPASNTLSWRWVAGLQTPGKTYLASAQNIARYSGGRFAAVGPLAARAEPLSNDAVPAPLLLPNVPEKLDLSEPWVLLVGEDDCDPTSLGLPIAGMKAVAGMASTAARSPLPSAPKPIAFSRGAVADALARVVAVAVRGCPATALPADAGPADVIAWARATSTRYIVTAYAPVGPGADWLATLEAPLADAGLALIRIRRTWDATLWPHATRGFFRFRKDVERLLRDNAFG